MRLLVDADFQSKADVVEVMNRFIADLGSPLSLRKISITESMIDQMTDEVTGNIQNDPATQEKEIVK